MQRSWGKRLWYEFFRVVCRVYAVILFRVRCYGREHVPKFGGALVLSNHQSNFDPVLAGLACDRRMNYLARQTLFGWAPFRWVLYSFDSIPIDREGTGLGGLKETLKRLKRGELVLIFPEGTRTRDGEVAPLKPGFLALARRAGVPLLPMAIDGAYQAWPRTQKYPRGATIQIAFAPMIEPDEIATHTDESLLAEVERRIRACHDQVRTGRMRSAGVPPLGGAVGDASTKTG